MIYLDNSATTPMYPEVVRAVQESFEKDYANSGAVYRLGLTSKNRIDSATSILSEILNIPDTHRMIFTSGGSESNNLFIKGILAPGKHPVSLGLEHPSVGESLRALASESVEPVTLLEHQEEGRLKLSALGNMKDTRLLCLSHVNHELGVVNNPAEIGPALKIASPRTRLFLDGVQAPGKIPLRSIDWKHISGYSLSAHKFGGPKGIGLLIYKASLDLQTQIHGGGQQYGVRSGTLPVPLIVGLTKALELTLSNWGKTQNQLMQLRCLLIDGLKSLEADDPDLQLKFNSSLSEDPQFQSPAILNFSFPPVEGETLLHHLEEKEIYVGLGSACSAKSKEPSKILTGIGRSKTEALCSLRISFGPQNTKEDVEQFVEAFGLAYKKLFPSYMGKK